MKRKYCAAGKKFFVILLCLMFSMNPSLGFCLPEGESVVSGAAVFDRSSANTLNINTPSQNLIVNYNSFSIAQPEAVHFHQPSSSAVALNRVVGADPSAIYGTLTANGRIFLINPNGVLFGQGARVDAAGLVASTLDISNENFLSGNYNFFKNGPGSFVVNQGQINITNGGYAYLLSQGIDNQGSLKADLGKVVLASGEKMTLALDDLNEISVVVDEAVKEGVLGPDAQKMQSAIKNSGTISAESGKVVLTAKSLNKVFDYAVNNLGIIQANSLVNNAGVVELLGQGADVLLATGSQTEAKALGEVGAGGRVYVNSTSGNTTVNPGAIIDVSAGSVAGNAGSVEVSALKVLNFSGSIIGRAALGYLGGVAILDPTDAIIGGGANLAADTTVWATNNITLAGDVKVDGNFILNLFADHNSPTAGDWDNGIGAILNPDNRRIEFINAADGSLNLKAGSGIGSAANPIKIRKINNLTAEINPASAAGDINIVSDTTNGAFIVGNLTTPSGNINLQNLDSGTITIERFDSLEPFAVGTLGGGVTISNVGSIDIPGLNSDGIFATGNVSLTTSASSSGITAGFDADAERIAAWSTLGNITLNTDDNIILGEGISPTNLLADAGNINLIAGNDISVDSGSVVEAILGNINLTADNVINLNLLKAGADVTVNAITGNGIITDNNGPANNIIANDLSLTAALGIDLDTSADTLTASSTNANIAIREANALAVNTITAGIGDVALTLAAGAISDNNSAGVNNIIANDLSLTAPAGINLDTAVDTLTASSTNSDIAIRETNGLGVNTVSAGTGDVTLTLANGAISDTNGLANNVTADNLQLDAVSGIDLDTNINTLDAIVNGTGNLNIDEANAITVTVADVINGNISVTAGGAITAMDLLSVSGDISLTANSGDINAGILDAQNTINLTATSGAISDNNGAANNVTAADLLLSANSGINLDTTVNRLQAVNTSGAIDLNNAGDLTLKHLSGPGVDAISNTGNVTVATDGLLTITDSLLTNGGNLVLNAANGITQQTLGDVDTSAGIGIPAGSYTANADTNNNDPGAYNLASGGSINTQDVDGSGNVTLTASDIVLGSASLISAGDAAINLSPSLNGITPRTIGLGTVAGDFTLNNDTLDALSTTGLVTIGAADSGDITVEDVAPLSFSNLKLITGGNINDANGIGNAVTIPNLTLEADTGIGTDFNPFTVQVDTLSASTNSGSIFISATDDVSLGLISAPDTVGLTADNGAISDGNAGATNISATDLVITAANGIGTLLDALETEVSQLNALNTVAGDINLANTGDLIIDDFNIGNGFGLENDFGNISIVNTGSIDMPGTNWSDIFASGNITLTASGALSDITAGREDSVILQSDFGSIDLNAGRDILLGESNASDIFTTTGPGAISLTAGRNINIDSFTFLNSDTGSISLTATGGDIALSDGSEVRSVLGDIALAASNNIGLELLDTGGNVNLTAGSLTDNNEEGIDDIIANDLALTVTSGINLDTWVNTLTASTSDADITIRQPGNIALNLVDAGAGNVTLSAMSINDNNDEGNNVIADNLTLTADSGIDLDTNINTLDAIVNGTGDLNIREADDITLANIDAIDGNINVNAGGAVIAGLLNAAGRVSLTSTSGAITDDNDLGDDVVSDRLILEAAEGIDLETMVNNLQATNAGGAIKLSNSGNLTLADLSDLGYAISNTGEVTITAPDIDITSSISAGDANIRLLPSFNGITPRTIGLGSATGDFTLTSAELEGVSTSGRVIIGSDDSGNILVDDLAPLGFSNLELATGGSINDVDDDNAITISDLTLRTNSIGTAGNILNLDVGTLTENIAPNAPTGLGTDHLTGVWSNNNLVGASWTGAIDPNFYTNSGIAGYSFVWDTSPDTIPDTTRDTDDVTSLSSLVQDGNSNFLHLRAQDRAGNWSEAIHLAGPVFIDTVKPVISAIRSVGPNAHGWNKSDVTVSFSGSDDLSGVAGITAPILFSLEGENQLATGTITDLAGNSAEVRETINIDKTSPVITSSRSIAPNINGWNKDDVTVSFEGDDKLSGVDSITGPILLGLEGANQSATGSIADLAGNSAQVTESGINIDKTPPAISASRDIPANAKGWNNTDVIARYSASDALSTLSSPATGSFTFTEEGANQSHTFTVTDLAGNSSQPVTISGVNIDKTAPVISASRDVGPNAHGWNKSDVTVNFSGIDGLSDIDIDSLTAPILFNTEGANQIARGSVRDLAGNSAEVTESGINIDKKAPEISTNPLNSSTSGTAQTFSFTATDALSGIDNKTSTSASGTVFNEGTHNVTITATDLAGNISQLPLSFTITSDFAESQSANALLLNPLLFSNPQTSGQFQLNSFDAMGPVFFYHPLTPVDLSAFDELSLEEGAYDFIEGSIKSRGRDDKSPVSEEKDSEKKKGKQA